MTAAAVERMGSLARRTAVSPDVDGSRMTAPTPNVAAAAGHGDDTRVEAALIDAAQAGDAAAFDQLVARYMRRAFAVAFRVLGQRQDAEDVVQEGFLAALVKIDTFERGRPFGPWLFRIVANRAINYRKARTLRRVDEIPADVPSGGESPVETAQRSELRRELERALAQLPEQQRWVVQLFDVDGFTGAEIAAMLEMAEGTVRWHLHEARKALRKALGHLAVRTP